MATLTANELKTRGIAAVEQKLAHAEEAIISVRGRPRFVILDLEHYERLREAEIASAWQDALTAEQHGDYIVESAAEHIARLQRGATDS